MAHFITSKFFLMPSFDTEVKEQGKITKFLKLLDPSGKIRVNRSIQVEGVFGVQKQNYKNDRFRRRALTKVSTEAILNFLGFNIAKLFRYFEKSALNDYWIALIDLALQTFKKPSWKRLAKKEKE